MSMKHQNIAAPPGALPAALLRLADPEKIGQAIDFLIDRLDALSADPDLEDDEGSVSWPGALVDPPAADSGDSEDEPNFAPVPGMGPGCAISDPDCCPAADDNPLWHADDGFAGDPDDAEWTRPEGVRQGDAMPQLVGGKADYDDDDEDSESDWEPGSENEPDFRRRRRTQAVGPGCPISDPDLCMAGDDRIASGPTPGGSDGFCRGPGDDGDAELSERIVPVFGRDQTRAPVQLVHDRHRLPVTGRPRWSPESHADQRWRGDGGRGHAE